AAAYDEGGTGREQDPEARRSWHDATLPLLLACRQPPPRSLPMADEPRTSTPPSGSSTGPGGGEERQLVLCPYCGRTQFNTERCEACGGLFEPLSRMATQIAMGPWFIRDKAQPFKPGCSYETLKRMIQRGAIHANTVIRGPT